MIHSASTPYQNFTYFVKSSFSANRPPKTGWLPNKDGNPEAPDGFLEGGKTVPTLIYCNADPIEEKDILLHFNLTNNPKPFRHVSDKDSEHKGADMNGMAVQPKFTGYEYSAGGVFFEVVAKDIIDIYGLVVNRAVGKIGNPRNDRLVVYWRRKGVTYDPLCWTEIYCSGDTAINKARDLRFETPLRMQKGEKFGFYVHHKPTGTDKARLSCQAFSATVGNEHMDVIPKGISLHHRLPFTKMNHKKIRILEAEILYKVPQSLAGDAASLIVTGAGSEGVDGTYHRDGHYLGKPRWKHETYDVWIRSVSIAENYPKRTGVSSSWYWYISKSPDRSTHGETYYQIQSTEDLPPAGNWTITEGNCGEYPTP